MGYKRPIDKSKKSNIYCDHCEHADRSCKDLPPWFTVKCNVSGEPKNYWNRCKQFEWRTDKEYINERTDLKED